MGTRLEYKSQTLTLLKNCCCQENACGRTHLPCPLWQCKTKSLIHCWMTGLSRGTGWNIIDFLGWRKMEKEGNSLVRLAAVCTVTPHMMKATVVIISLCVPTLSPSTRNLATQDCNHHMHLLCSCNLLLQRWRIAAQVWPCNVFTTGCSPKGTVATVWMHLD